MKILLISSSPHKEKSKTFILAKEVLKGLPQEILDICDTTLEIEQYGTTRSLNVSVSTGIVLYDYRVKTS